MQARTDFILALAGMRQRPDPRDLAREQLADVMPAIAIALESLTHAHIVRAPQWPLQLYYVNPPSRITAELPAITPPPGQYSAWFRLESHAQGFAVTAHLEQKQPLLQEHSLSVDVTAEGLFAFRTQNAAGGIVRQEALADTHAVLAKFGEWARRNFSLETLRDMAEWAPKAAQLAQSRMPQPKTDMINPFAAKGRLTVA